MLSKVEATVPGCAVTTSVDGDECTGRIRGAAVDKGAREKESKETIDLGTRSFSERARKSQRNHLGPVGVKSWGLNG